LAATTPVVKPEVITSAESERIILPSAALVNAGLTVAVSFTEITPDAVAVSLRRISQLLAANCDRVDATGLINEVTTTESAASVFVQEIDKVAVVLLSDFRVVAAPAVDVTVKPVTTADEGPTDRTPKPSAATTASAIRLKVVLLDICFLSIVVTETFSVAALR